MKNGNILLFFHMANFTDHSRINSLAQNYLDLITKENELPLKEKIRLRSEKNTCLQNLIWLVSTRTGKYKKFPNYEDLMQDGQEALIMALNSYKPGKGNFLTWAHYYIKTKLSRRANKHSALHIPMAVAKDHKPHKVNELPVMIDDSDPQEKATKNELLSKLEEVINTLPDLHQLVLRYAYGMEIDGIILSKRTILQRCGIKNKDYKLIELLCPEDVMKE
jgi:RNA polymerase sigma factor (sigma-70 family)